MRFLDMLHAVHGFTLVIHGDAKGADWCADRWATKNRLPIERFPAHWKLHHNGAGPIRNRQMLDEAKPGLVIAFPGGSGTADMMKQAREAGVRVIDLSKERNRIAVTEQWRIATRTGALSQAAPSSASPKITTAGAQPTASATAMETSGRSER
ncbi:SLOG family protein [Bradyrhizobium arachidis]|uniref:DUF2493 domain-containing protein n=1 Tax=Bradyrhizobium arachidis TaxID=858423 RepID=A0AAE7NNV8_9BRAD|nr:SLOG family protein [Bradyrhizobium arachidis]QOZ68877.1 DUF2493 domain-containing protein [Bradyrhizobium arachidis]